VFDHFETNFGLDVGAGATPEVNHNCRADRLAVEACGTVVSARGLAVHVATPAIHNQFLDFQCVQSRLFRL